MKRIGLLVPKTNLTVEYEIQYLSNNGYYSTNEVIFYTSKLQYKTRYKDNSTKYLNDLLEDIKDKMLLLQYLKVNQVAFFCTLASIKKYDLKIPNPAKALIENACKKQIKNALLITPYNNEMGILVKDMLEKNKVKVEKNINLDLKNTHEYFEFGLNKLEKFIENNFDYKYNNVIISCTNIPTIHFINRIEKKLNTKVISSNSSLFFKILNENNKESKKLC